jgi:hypothetical protein
MGATITRNRVHRVPATSESVTTGDPLFSG